ncbi:MAG: hypothetical protein COA78_27675 [Blastopirellula sp.]|nr:MAG: hypothetical protein COA78_27675 [Blastopirellula sp.]
MSAAARLSATPSTGPIAWLPLVVLPVGVVVLGSAWPAWVFMWAVAFSFFGSLKWLTLCDALGASNASRARCIGYLLLWPGMNARVFLATSKEVKPPRLADWLFAFGKLTIGLVLLFITTQLIPFYPKLAGWIGIAGIVFTLHFGLFHLLANGWRQIGVNAVPIMNAPILSTSLGNFWGHRWNLAFRDLAHAYVFRPAVSKLGIAGASLAVFLVSGLVHEVVISIPAQGGYGLPTLYFVIQAVGQMFERSRLGKTLHINRGLTGRAFTVVVVLAPFPLLIHGPFMNQVLVPMFAVLANYGS